MRLGVPISLFISLTSMLLLRQIHYGQSLLIAPLWVWGLCGIDLVLLVLICLDLRALRRGRNVA